MKRKLKIDDNGKVKLEIVPSWYDYLSLLVYCLAVYAAVFVGIFLPKYTEEAIFIALIALAVAITVMLIGEIRKSVWKKWFEKYFSGRSEKEGVKNG